MEADSQGADEETQKLFQQFKSIFGNDADVNLYFALNPYNEDSDDVAHVRIEQMMTEMNELTNSSSSTSKTVTTNLSPDSTDIEPIFEEIIVTPSTTSSSSMSGVRLPSPPYRDLIKHASFQLQQHHQLHYPRIQVDSDEEGITLTEIVEVHRIPSMALISLEDNNNPSQLTTTPTITTAATTTTLGDDDADIESNVNNNNTSCSLSSTLTDSKTLDVRTPIVV